MFCLLPTFCHPVQKVAGAFTTWLSAILGHKAPPFKENVQCSQVPSHCRNDFFQAKANCSAEMWDYIAPHSCFFTHSCSAKVKPTHMVIEPAQTTHFGQAWHKAPCKVEWWVLKSLYISQPGHKLNWGGAVWIEPSQSVRCSARPMALCLHPGPVQWVLIFICLITKDQLEERLPAEKIDFTQFLASAVNGEKRVEQTESSSLLDGKHGYTGKHFTSKQSTNMDAASSDHLPFSIGKEKNCNFHYQHYSLYVSRWGISRHSWSPTEWSFSSIHYLILIRTLYYLYLITAATSI